MCRHQSQYYIVSGPDAGNYFHELPVMAKNQINTLLYILMGVFVMLISTQPFNNVQTDLVLEVK